MEHLVKFRTAEGRDGQHTAAALDEALRFVERLRNHEGASEVRVFRMQEIPIEFKAYFKVELRPGEDAEGVEPAAPVEALRPPTAPGVPAPAAAEGESEASARRLFSRG